MLTLKIKDDHDIAKKKANLKKKKKYNVSLLLYKEIFVNLLVVDIDVMFCFVKEFLSFRGKY